MSLARAFTKRMRSTSSEDSHQPSTFSHPSRGFSIRGKSEPKSFDRSKISLPLELLSSSNSLAFEAPDLPTFNMAQIEAEAKRRVHASVIAEEEEAAAIASAASEPAAPATPTSSASSRKSYEDSLKSPGLSSASSVTSADSHSREGTPVVSPESAKAGGRTFYFDGELSPLTPPPALVSSQSSLSVLSSATVPTTTIHEESESQDSSSQRPSLASTMSMPSIRTSTPSVPQRAPSHTKKTHQTLARQRSMRLSNPQLPPPSASAAAGGRMSHSGAPRQSKDILGVSPEADHPFGAELKQVNELAEEFGMSTRSGAEKGTTTKLEVVDEESEWLRRNGFGVFSADEYAAEIQGFWNVAYGSSVIVPVPESIWL